jgi:hypothetical protein
MLTFEYFVPSGSRCGMARDTRGMRCALLGKTEMTLSGGVELSSASDGICG